MPGVTKEQIQAAREADLFTYLQFHEPGVLKQDGPNFRHKEHDSLVYVTGKRYWYWNSRGRSINALDYLIQIRGYKLTDVLENRSERNRWINHFMKFSTMEDIDRRAVMQLIRSIRVMGKDELHIEFNYQDEYQKAISLAEQIATKNEERMVS